VSAAYLGDCLLHLRTMEECTFDSLVTDPPAGIGFMGKDWDHHRGGRDQWTAWMTEIMRECLRVLKPGAHGLVWALPRTSHWTATALEDAGFEVRDVVTHLFGSGFPKSLDVSKAIDKAAGAERESHGKNPNYRKGEPLKFSGQNARPNLVGNFGDITAPATDDAKTWQGWGTALKPASEHWILVRKPISEKTVAANVLKWGTGALNIDASRIGVAEDDPNKRQDTGGYASLESKANTPNAPYNSTRGATLTQGRFPANLVLSHTPYCTDEICDLECAIQMLDEQSGLAKPQRARIVTSQPCDSIGTFKTKLKQTSVPEDSGGGASRFFYCAKISKSERNAGLDDCTEKVRRSDARPNSGDSSGKFPDHDSRERSGNHHPTVKPKKLMAYLIRMVTPPGGAVLDPFMGSGSTGVAAHELGHAFVGVEQDPDYFEIAQKRISHAEKGVS
jgi:DNA modification methylase